MVARVGAWAFTPEQADNMLGRLRGVAGQYRTQPGCQSRSPCWWTSRRAGHA